MRKLSGSWWRFVAERVSLVRALREAKAVARLVSTSKCEKTHSVIVRDGTLTWNKTKPFNYLLMLKMLSKLIPNFLALALRLAVQYI